MLIVEKPVHTIQTNIMGTEAVLRAALRYRAKVLIASTSEVYGKGNRVPFSEDDDVVLGPTCRSRWAYAASKMVDEFLALAYHREKGLPVVVFRLFNTVGPRQTGRYGMVIPRFVQLAMRGEPLKVYGDGKQSRCFLHVADAVSAILALGECPEAIGEVFNVGSTQEVTIGDLACHIIEMVDHVRHGTPIGGCPEGSLKPSDRIQYVPYEEAYAVGFEDMRKRIPDICKIQQITGWSPKKGLEETLQDVIEEYSRVDFSKLQTDFA
jgi:UDP-glucose 4-epimerase